MTTRPGLLAEAGRVAAGHLTDQVLPFWLERGIDTARGGFFTCFSNDGEALLADLKYTWSQGRFIWLLARLAQAAQAGTLRYDPAWLLDQADRGADFCLRHAVLPDGSCAFVTTADGEPVEDRPGQGLATSLFADCFLVLGLAALGRVTRNRSLLDRACLILDGVEARVASGAARTEPYPVPIGHRALSVAMIRLNVAEELGSALVELGHPAAERIAALATRCGQEVIGTFLGADGMTRELVAGTGETSTLLSRHRTPGHALEASWFLLHAADRGFLPADVPAARLAVRACELGWDPLHGGLLRYVGPDGGAPEGQRVDDPYQALIEKTWDTKLWWPHAEALYGLLRAYRATAPDDPLAGALEQWWHRVAEYTFDTFPSPVPGREWIQIRARNGEPLEEVVALPVKDPFHIARALLLIVELGAAGEAAPDGRRRLTERTTA